jgi:hypothetical protein
MYDQTMELELLEGFRKLGPTARNTVMTAVAMAVTAEDAVRREYESSRDFDGIPSAEPQAVDGLAVITG